MSCEAVGLDSCPMPVLKGRYALVGEIELPLRGRLFPLGFPVDIFANRPDVLKAAAESFGHRVRSYDSEPLTIRIAVSDGCADRPPLPIRRQYEHLYSMVADAENQAVLDLRTGANFVWLSQGAVTDTLYLRHNFLEKVTYLLLGAMFVTDIHAACVGRNGKGILLCGDSGAGKSTLSYACAKDGWTYTSDDTCYLINSAQNPRVIGHAHRIRFRPHARALFPELQSRPIVERMEGKRSIEVPISELPVRDAEPEADVCAIVYLRRHVSANTRLIPLPGRSATARMVDDLYSVGELRIKHSKILEKVAATPTFELHYDRMEDALGCLNELTDGL